MSRFRHVTPDVPPIWLALFALAAWLLGRFVPLVTFDFGVLGRVLIWLGIALIIWAAWWFWRKRTPIEPGRRPRALIVEGPYRINRNPIYTGLTLILAGFALNLGALGALLVVPVFPILITARFIRKEEAAMRREFGAAAEAFFSKTRRW